MLFNDTWSQSGHSVSCMTILFLNLQIIRSDIRPHIKWVVSLVIAYGHFNLPLGFVWVCMGIITNIGRIRIHYDCTKATIHQVTTMLATSKNVLFPGHNPLLTTGTDDPTL